MSLLSRIANTFRSNKSAHPKDPVIAGWWGGADTASGMSVTNDSAKGISAVYAAIRVLAESLAQLPLNVYRRTPTGKERDLAHPLYDLLHNAPNGDQTSFEWREMMMGHTALRGRAYSKIISLENGAVEQLIPLNPDLVFAFRAPNGEIAFRYSPPDGPQQILLDHEVMRVPGWSEDGLDGMSPLAIHRETFGQSLAAKRYLSRFYGNSAVPKGGVEVPEVLQNDTSVEQLRESWERRHKGVDNAHRLAIFDGGMKWVNLGITNEDAQYLELQQFDVGDIARIFRVPPHKIGDLSKATFSNIEQQSIDFVTDTLLPWLTRWEARLNRSLLSRAGRQTHVIGFEVKGLLRGDSTARANLYRAMFNMGALSPNDIRQLEDMPTIDGGDSYYVPLNMAPADKQMDILLRASGDKESRLHLLPNGHDTTEETPDAKH